MASAGAAEREGLSCRSILFVLDRRVIKGWLSSEAECKVQHKEK